MSNYRDNVDIKHLEFLGNRVNATMIHLRDSLSEK